MEIFRVQQEDVWGCQVAVLAMILGISYKEALKLYPHHPDDHQGFPSFTLETILTEKGFAIAKQYKVRTGFNNEERPVWPPKPFADLHWCQVQTIQGAHAVLMMRDGTVIDPWVSSRKSLLDEAYLSVSFVAAVVPIQRPPGNEGVLNVLRSLRRSIEDRGLAKDPLFRDDFHTASIVLGRGY